MSAPAPAALAGIRVVELATVIMAPLAAQLLGDLGADVIRVEGGPDDISRAMDPGPHPELSGVALNLHRNKRSIAIDLSSDSGRDAIAKLLNTADIFITNLRPGPLSRLRLDYDHVAPTRPRLIYVQAQGFRTDDAEQDRPAFDDIIQAETGIPQLIGDIWEEPRFVPAAMADKVAGYTIVQAVLAALFHRERHWSALEKLVQF